jgi:predicted nucleic acid-binding protein
MVHSLALRACITHKLSVDKPLDGETGRRAFGDIVHLARSYQLSAHDAAYLELAIRLGLPLACLDGKLKTAAAAAGVVLFSAP